VDLSATHPRVAHFYDMGEASSLLGGGIRYLVFLPLLSLIYLQQYALSYAQLLTIAVLYYELACISILASDLTYIRRYRKRLCHFFLPHFQFFPTLDAPHLYDSVPHLAVTSVPAGRTGAMIPPTGAETKAASSPAAGHRPDVGLCVD
jgi:hypothetical protein